MLRRMKSTAACVLCAGVLLTASVLVPAAAVEDNWPQWRGPGGSGVSAATTYPEEWGPDKNIAWKTPVPGRGLSSPIVWGNRLFITTSIEGGPAPADHKPPIHPDFNNQPGYLHPDSVGSNRLHTLKVLAFDTKTGKQVWEHTAYEGTMFDDRHKKNTYASPTMVTNGKAVYAFFESGGILSYDFDGKLLWKKSLGGIAKAGLGPGTSPVLFEDLIILQCDQEMGGGYIVALKQSDGSEVWRVTRKNRRSWATPLLVKAPNRTELVASGAESVIAYDPRTGKELWTGPGTVGHPIPSSVAGDGVVIVSAGSSERGKRAIAIKPGGEGELANTPSILWQRDKNTAYVPSPILHGKYVYLMTDKGLITCLDAHTGELLYEGGRPPVPATFTASLVAYGERLLMTSEDGDTFVIKAGPTHEILRTNPIGEPVYASLALAGGTIYIRGESNLYAVRDVKP